MSGMNRPTHYNPFHLADYVDLADLQDDKTPLRNPHRGWYVHYVDNGFGSPVYRDSIEEGDFLEDFPGLNHLYLRFDWRDVEPENGVFDFSRLDEIIETWGKHGYRFSLRPCTYECFDNPLIKSATPEWVWKAGAAFTNVNDTYEPDYSDPVFLSYLDRMMHMLGEHYAADPRLEFIDVGTFGTWGEGHTIAGSDKIFPLETMLKHIDLHVKHFPDSYILLNDDYVNCRPEPHPGETDRILSYAKQLGLGLRDDSVCVDGYVMQYGYDTLRTPMLFDEFWRNAPIDMEFAHMWHYTNPKFDPPLIRDGYPAMEACRRSHASFAGFHGSPREFLKQFPTLADYLGSRLGYWFFIDGLQLPKLVSGARNHIDIVFENRGFAPCYHKFEVRLRLVSENGTCRVMEQDIDPRRWLPGEMVIEHVEIDTRGLPSGAYRLEAGIFEGSIPIKIGMNKQLLRNGGYYDLAEAVIE